MEINAVIQDRLEAIPELSEFYYSIDSKINLTDNDSFWDCEDDFCKLLRSDFPLSFINYELTRTLGSETYISPGNATDNDYSIILSKKFQLSMKILEQGTAISEKLYSATEHLFIGCVDFKGTGPFYTDLFKQPDPFPVEVLDRTKAIYFNKRQEVKPSGIMKVIAGEDTISMLQPKTPIVLLLLASRNLYKIRWEYDRKTLCPIRSISLSPNASRLEYTARMLSEIGDDSSIDPLKALLKHEAHFVRWEAIRSVMRLDFNEGVMLLKKALDDDHPHVRNAARKSLCALGIPEENSVEN